MTLPLHSGPAPPPLKVFAQHSRQSNARNVYTLVRLTLRPLLGPAVPTPPPMLSSSHALAETLRAQRAELDARAEIDVLRAQLASMQDTSAEEKKANASPAIPASLLLSSPVAEALLDPNQAASDTQLVDDPAGQQPTPASAVSPPAKGVASPPASTLPSSAIRSATSGPSRRQGEPASSPVPLSTKVCPDYAELRYGDVWDDFTSEKQAFYLSLIHI